MMTKHQKALLKCALPTYIKGKEDLLALHAVAKALGDVAGGYVDSMQLVVAMNAIADICKPFNIIRSELELLVAKMPTVD